MQKLTDVLVSYYITDLPQYSSLAPCASKALSYAVLAVGPSIQPHATR